MSARIVVLATLVVPDDEGAAIGQIEAQAADALRTAGFLVARLDAESADESGERADSE